MKALVALLAGAALATCAAPPARADAPPAAPACAGPSSGRAPDPRCDEQLDGREPAATSTGRKVGRVALFVPRVVAAGLFWPVVETSELIEAHHAADWAEAWLTSDDGKVGVRPLLTYATGFRPTLGVRVFYRRLPGVGTGVSASVESAGPSVIVGDLTAAAPARTGLTFRAVASRRDDRYFAGIGPLTNEALAANGWSPSRFDSDILSAEVRWSRHLPAYLHVAAHAEVQRRDYRADDVRGGPSIATVFRTPSPACDATTALLNACVDPAQVPGFQSGLRLFQVGAAVLWDYRSHSRDGSGAALALEGTFAQGIAGDPSRNFFLAAEPELAWGGIDRQLLFHGRAAVVEAVSDAPIQFEELVVMSGYSGMRGFPDGRFRGQSGLVGTLEYRWYVSQSVDASLFTDLGTVAGHNFAGLGSAHWFPSYGLGLRLYQTPLNYWEGSVQSGVQIAYAPGNGFRLILAVATF